MRTKLRSKVTLFFIVSALLLAIPAVAALAQDTSTSTAAPTIQSDKADYAPGELVTLTGSGWQPGESVNVFVNDEEGQTWSRNVDVSADESGNITDQFNLPDWFVATYKVTATGELSGVATTSFTDGNVLAKTSGLSVPILLHWEKFNNNTDCSGIPDFSQGTFILPNAEPQLLTGVDDGQSIRMTLLGGPGVEFVNWTSGSEVRTSLLTCVAGSTAEQVWTANFGAAPTSVDTTTTASNASATYGASSVQLNATVTPTSGTAAVNTGTVTFTVKNSDGTTIGNPVTSGTVSNGSASASFPLSGVNADTYTIEAVYNAGTGFNASNNSTQSPAPTLTFNKADTTTTVTCEAGQFTYTGSPHTPCTAKVTSPGGLDQSLPVDYQANTNAGTATATASFAGNGNYNASSDSKTFTIGKANTTTTVTCEAGQFTYNGSAHTPCSASVSGPGGLNNTLPVDYQENTNAGTATASASYAGNGNYNASSDSKAFTIGKANTTTTVTCEAGPFTYNGSAHTPCSAKVTGPGNLDQSLTVDYQDNTNAGTATASASYAETANYKGSSDSKTFTIGKKELLVNAKDQSTVYGDQNLPPTYELSGFVNNEDKDSAGITGAPVCFISGSAGPNVGEYSDAIVCAPGTLSADNYSFAAGSKGKLTITSITYNFSGFRSPVDNPGTGATPVFNSAKAGQSIPVKFGLGGNQGLNIIAAGYPKVTSVNCVSSATVAPIEEYAASMAEGGLTYDATADQYNYVWKTQSTYVNKCYKFDLQLTDGTSHVAYFKFLK